MLAGWFKDVVNESLAGKYSHQMDNSFRQGMSWNLSGIVDSLENRVIKLLQEYEILKSLKIKLEDEITILKSQQDQNIIEIDSWKDECNTLRIANSMLGSNKNKRETKLKINELVREIDKCITQLSE
jgi:hypothetical protein